MGIYDRDWWRERHNQRTNHDERKDANWRRPESEGKQAAKDAAYNPKAFRSANQQQDRSANPQKHSPAAPPDMPGADWHWTIKLVVAGWCLMLLYLASKLAMGLPL